MSVPHRNQAALLLTELAPPGWLLRHSAAVAEIAAFLAERIEARGAAVDRPLVETAALLHDVDKTLPRDHPLLELGHGQAGAAWLAERGHGELSAAVAAHPATLLTDERRYPRWAAESTLEERVVAYADKRAMQRIVTLAERFAEWQERHPEHAAELRLGLRRAELLEQEVCELAGVTPSEVTRLAWVDAALHAAGRPMTASD